MTFFFFEKSVDHAQIATRNRINHLLSRFTFVARENASIILCVPVEWHIASTQR